MMRIKKGIFMRDEKFSLDSYGYDNAINISVQPIINLIRMDKILEAERKIISLANDYIEKDEVIATFTDNCFTLLDIYLGDNFPDLLLRKEIRDLIFECMTLHDLGKPYGANVEMIKLIIKKLQD